MAPRSQSPPLLPLLAIGRSERRTARLAAAAIRLGRPSADNALDSFLPAELREVSGKYWTPLPVVRRAAQWLREARVRTIVDIGSGAGKFCVAAALLTRCRFVGVEHRDALVAAARELAATFDVDDRVTFVSGDVSAMTGVATEAYYLFNPFGDYSFGSPRFDEPHLPFTPDRHARDRSAATALLSEAPAGTLVVTYNGLGVKIPPCYAQIDVAVRVPGTLRLWKKSS